MRAIRHVLSGTIYVSDKMSAQILEVFSGGPSRQQRSLVQRLSDREFEIFELFGKGLSTQQIANRLCVSMKTVSAHRANIKEKLELRTTNELVAYAARWTASRVQSPSAISDKA